MRFRTLLELQPILKTGDWLIPEGKSVAMEVHLYHPGHQDEHQFTITKVELCEDWCKSYPTYDWDDSTKFAYISKEDMERVTS